jgi:glucosamine-phosphate N-acetyltransferase
MKKTNGVRETYFVVVVEETAQQRVVGAATLVAEQKFIRGASLAGHVEDVVTDASMRGRGVGKVLMEALLLLSRHVGCYKTLLDCDEKNVPFYAQFGFKPKVSAQNKPKTSLFCSLPSLLFLGASNGNLF